MIEIKSPKNIHEVVFENNLMGIPKLFLGGSIEQGKADNWQIRIVDSLKNKEVTILNPRRDDWDSSWKQDPTLGTKFRGQVDWELYAQDISQSIIYYFDENTKSPITLLELGLYAHYNNFSKKVFVFCTEKFWRYGNVKIVCEKFNIPVYNDEQKIINTLQKEFINIT